MRRYSIISAAIGLAALSPFAPLTFAAERAETANLKGHEMGVFDLAFSPDGKLLASVGHDGTVRVWDVAGKRALSSRRTKTDTASVAFSPDGRLLATRGADEMIRIWKVETLRETAVLAGHKRPVTCVAFSPDGKTLVSGARDNTIRFWDPSDGKQKAIITCTPLVYGMDGMNSARYSPDGTTLATAQNDGAAILWDAATRKERFSLPNPDKRRLRSIRFSPDGKLLAAAENGDALRPQEYIRLWDASLGTERSRIELKGELFSAMQIEFLPDGKTLVCGHGNGNITAWDVATGAKKAAWSMGPDSVVFSLSVSPDGRTLAAGGEGVIRLWDISDLSDRQTEKTGEAAGRGGPRQQKGLPHAESDR